MRKGPILLLILITCVGCDQATKYTAKYFLEGKRSLSYAGDMLRLGYAENTGAFLSLGSNLPDTIRMLIFTVMAALFLVGFVVYLLRNETITKNAMIAGSLIVAGGVGNLIDRIVNEGAVIDFLNVGIGSLRTGIFNVADMSIMAGIFMFLFATHGMQKEEAAKAEDNENTAEQSQEHDRELEQGGEKEGE